MVAMIVLSTLLLKAGSFCVRLLQIEAPKNYCEHHISTVQCDLTFTLKNLAKNSPFPALKG